MGDSRVEVLRSRSARKNEGAIIAVEGDLDIGTMALLDDRLSEGDGSTRVTIDLSHLGQLDEEAITSILRGVHTLRAAGADLVVRYPSPTPRQFAALRSSILGADVPGLPPETSDQDALPSDARASRTRSRKRSAR